MTLSKPRRGRLRRRFLGVGAAAVLSLGLGYVYLASTAAADQLSVEAAHAQADTGEIVLIDIRRPDEWARTGVPAPGLAIDMRRPDFEAAVSAAADGRPVALICARGVRSRAAVARLIAAGVPQVIDVPEGMLGSLAGVGWLKKGLPVRAPDG